MNRFDMLSISECIAEMIKIEYEKRKLFENIVSQDYD